MVDPRGRNPDSSKLPHELSAAAAAWIGRFREQNLQPYLEKWRQRLRTDPRTGLILKPLDQTDLTGISFEKLAFHTGAGLRWALRLYPPFALSVFALSFFLPYPLVAEILRSVSVAGMIGYGTNWIAVQMLFRPRENRPVFGQGLIPSQRNEIIRKVADEVIEKLINETIIHQELEESRLISRLTAETAAEIRRLVRDPEFVRDTKQVILTYAGRFARSEPFRDEVNREVERRVEGIAGRSFSTWLMSRLGGVWREPLTKIVTNELDQLPDTLDRLVGEVDTALDYVPSFLEEKQKPIEAALTRIVMALIRQIDVRRVVLKQLSTVTSEQLEVGFREFADDKLSYITLLGGLLGAIGGFVIIWPWQSLLAIAGLLLLLGGLDLLLHALIHRFAPWWRRGRPAANGAAGRSAPDGELAAGGGGAGAARPPDGAEDPPVA